MNYENLISIVMPVFNAQAYLEEALESVRRQTWTDWELLVVDDHSTDGSAGLVSEICRKDARIRLLSQMDGIKGAANARNFGTAHANGRYLAFMDADDIWRVDNGMFVEHWDELNTLQLLAQMGALPQLAGGDA